MLTSTVTRLIAGLYDAIVREGGRQEGLLTLLDSRDDAAAGMAAGISLRYRPERCVAGAGLPPVRACLPSASVAAAVGERGLGIGKAVSSLESNIMQGAIAQWMHGHFLR
jgi:hypothetical protein